MLLTAAGQVGLLGGHDFIFEATVGLLGAVFCLAVAVGSRSRVALIGFALSLLPVAMLVYFLTTTAG